MRKDSTGKVTMRRHPMAELSPQKRDRACPSCRIRYRLEPTITPNYVALDIDKGLWERLRDAAETFDRAAVGSDCGSEDPDHDPFLCGDCAGIEYQSGAGDGVSRFTAREFIEWLKPDCIGFRDFLRPEADGAKPRNVDGSLAINRGSDSIHRHPFPLPFVEDVRRRAG